MTWDFHVLAITQRRLFSHILQVLESQMVRIPSFSGETNDIETCITIIVSFEQDKAYRIEALLHRLEGVRSVSQLRTDTRPFVSLLSRTRSWKS